MITNKEYDITDCANNIIENIPPDRLESFYDELSQMVEFQRQHSFDTLLWIDDGKKDTYIDNIKQTTFSSSCSKG